MDVLAFWVVNKVMKAVVTSALHTRRKIGRVKATVLAVRSNRSLLQLGVAILLCSAARQGVVGQNAAGQATPSQTEPALAPVTTNANLYVSMEALDDTQRIGVGDRLSFRVIEDKEDSKLLAVADSGELEIPYLGRVKAADKTCKELAREIKTALEKDLYYKATVIVAVDQLNKKRGNVYLVGQIRTPGPQDIPSDEVFTLSKALLRAGGFGDFADKKHIKLTRKPGPGQSDNKIFVVDVAEILERGKTEKDLKLEPGDLIFVPSRLINF
jgi:polysaccharide export outer membrane protein